MVNSYCFNLFGELFAKIFIQSRREAYESASRITIRENVLFKNCNFAFSLFSPIGWSASFNWLSKLFLLILVVLQNANISDEFRWVLLQSSVTRSDHKVVELVLHVKVVRTVSQTPFVADTDGTDGYYAHGKVQIGNFIPALNNLISQKLVAKF